MSGHARAAGLLSSLLALAAASADAPRLSAKDLSPLLGALWSGTLTYRDYGTGEPVSIRSTLVVTQSATDPAEWRFDYGYPDEPGAASQEGVVIGDGGRTLNGEPVIDVARPAADRWIVVTETRATDDGRPATIRRTYDIGTDLFSISKEVRIEGAVGFFERNRFRWRRQPSLQ
jgi:hypothetical protein